MGKSDFTGSRNVLLVTTRGAHKSLHFAVPLIGPVFFMLHAKLQYVIYKFKGLILLQCGLMKNTGSRGHAR